MRVRAYDGEMFGNRARGYRNIPAAAGSFQAKNPNLDGLSALSLVEGDLLYVDAAGLQRLAKGTANQRLRMNAAGTAPEWGTAYTATGTAGPPTSGTWAVGDQAMGLYGLWVCTAAGTPGTWAAVGEHLIGKVIGAVSTASFASIPQVYNQIVVRFEVWSNRDSTLSGIAVQANGDTGANYYGQGVSGNASAANSGETIANTRINLGTIPGNWRPDATLYAHGEVQMPFYANTTRAKSFMVPSAGGSVDYTTGKQYVATSVNTWASVAAITSLYFYSTYGGGLLGDFYLYGKG